MDKYAKAALIRSAVIRMADDGITIRDVMRSFGFDKARAAALLMRMHKAGELARHKMKEPGQRECFVYRSIVDKTRSAKETRQTVTNNLPQYSKEKFSKQTKPRLFGGL
jgi:predicted transcriptional regulator